MSEKDIIIPTDMVNALAPAIEQMMRPFVEHMVKLVSANTEALEQIASQSAIFADRLEALEKEVRLGKKVTNAQKKYLNDAMTDRAVQLLDKHDIHDRDTIMKLTRTIRKGVLSRLGIGSTGEIPQHEYSVVMEQINIWNDFIKVRDIVRSAKVD